MNIDALQATLRRFAAELTQLADQAAIALDAGPGAKTHVLIDWENVQPDEHACRALVPEATDVWLFRGRHQKGVADQYGTFGARATEVVVTRPGKNALDFHLSFYMGYIASKQPDARFVVISNDKGYGPMLAHAEDLGFRVHQSSFGGGRRAATATSARKRPAAKTPATGTAARKAAKKAAPKTAAKAARAAKPASVVELVPAPARTAARPARKSAATVAAKAPAAKALEAKVPAAKAPEVKAPTVKAPAVKRAAAKKAPVAAEAAKTKTPEQVLAILRKRALANRPNKRARLLSQVAQLLGGDADAAAATIDRLAADGHLAIDARGAVTYVL